MLKNCVIEIQGRHLFAHLILFDMEEFDVIVDMDWLSSYHACVEWFWKELFFKPLSEIEFCFSSYRF